MTKSLLLAVGLTLLASPALSQSSPRPDDRDSYADRRDRDRGWGRERDGWHGMSDDERGGSGRGARFMVRNGDAVVAVRCDGSEPMRACVDATLTLLDRVRSMPPAPTSGPGPGSTQPPR
jgi:hypothetical protein